MEGQVTAPAPQSAPASSPAPEGSPGSQNTGPAASQGQAKPEAPRAPEAKPEYFEIKVDGKTKRMTRDELIRSAQLGMTATERFEQAAAKERKALEIISKAKKNPIQALMDPTLGLTKEQVREAMEAWYSQEFIEPETLSKEQLRIRELERKLKEHEEIKAAEEAKNRQAKEEEMTRAQRESLQKQIVEAIEEHKLPKDKFTVSRIAFYMRQAARKGFDAPMSLIISQVRNERNNLVAGLAQGATYEQLVDIFGDETINAIRKADLERLRQKRGISSQPKVHDEPRDRSGKIDYDEVNRRLKAMRMGQ